MRYRYWWAPALLFAWGLSIGAAGGARAQSAPAGAPARAPAAPTAPAPASGGELETRAEQAPVFTIERMDPAPAPAAQAAPANAPAASERVAPAPARELGREPFLPVRREPREPEPPSSFRAVLTLSYVFGPLLALGATSQFGAAGLSLFALPVITHFAYLDAMGGVITLFAYPGLVLGAGLAGAAIDTSSCDDDEWFCGFGGAIVGGLVGMIVWPIIDVVAIAPRTWRSAHPPDSGMSLNVLPGGGASLSWNGRF